MLTFIKAFTLLIMIILYPIQVSAEIYMPSAPKSERLAAVDAFWADWKRVYLREGCGGVYVDTSGDDKQTWGGSHNSTLTVSEAHGYGMVALVRMAHRDPNAHRLFDGMVEFYKAHPAASDAGLMAWNQTRDCVDAPDGGDMSATDGDLDIALALQLADDVWGGYSSEARTARDAILAQEVTFDGMMRLGDWANTGEYAYSSRSSDFMPASFAIFAKAGDNHAREWRAIRERGYAVWGTVARNYAKDTGLVPDFLIGLPSAPRPAKADFLEGSGDGQFSWNALRFPWRLSLDLLETGDIRAQTHLEKINRWIRNATNGDPLLIASTYRLNGTSPRDQSDNSTAFVAMFAAGALAGSGDPQADQIWIDMLWSTLISAPISDEDYYGNTLKLMAMIALADLWKPLE